MQAALGSLKAAVEDLLPPEIRRRGKRGFGVPLDRASEIYAEWAACSGAAATPW